MLRKILIVLSVFILLLSAREAFCFDESEVYGLKEVGFFSGYAQGELKYDQGDYEMVLGGARIGWNIKPAMKFIDFPQKSLCTFTLEPYINTITSPGDTDVEIGNAFFFKYGHPLFNGKLMPYIEFGSGMQWMSQHVDEQSTQFNFASAGGAGIYYFLREDLAVNAGYRFRHMSNCSIDEPNAGVNTQHYTLGISWIY